MKALAQEVKMVSIEFRACGVSEIFMMPDTVPMAVIERARQALGATSWKQVPSSMDHISQQIKEIYDDLTGRKTYELKITQVVQL